MNYEIEYILAGKGSDRENKVIEIGKYLTAFTCLIIPVYAVYEKLSLTFSVPVTVLLVAAVTAVSAIIFTVAAEKFVPFIYFQKK